MKNYVVVTADIINSKKQNINEKSLKDRLEELNEKFRENICAGFTLLRGDEMQAVVGTGDKFMPMIRNLRYVLKPKQLRIGVGLGNVDEERIVNKNPWENNGEAFHLARRSVEILKNNSLYKKKQRTYIHISERIDRNQNNKLNVMLNLYDIILDSWTDSQWDSIMAYEKAGTYKKAEEILQRKFQSIHRSAAKAAWEEVSRAEQIISGYIEECLN